MRFHSDDWIVHPLRTSRRFHAVSLVAAGLTLASANPLSLLGQTWLPGVTAIAEGDSVDLPVMHHSRTDANGLTIAGQAFHSGAGNLADRELPQLEMAPSGFVRIAMEPAADSLWVTPVVDGRRQPDSVIDRGFQAPPVPGRYEFFVSGQWATLQDGRRPPSGPARTGVWALRLIVR